MEHIAGAGAVAEVDLDICTAIVCAIIDLSEGAQLPTDRAAARSLGELRSVVESELDPSISRRRHLALRTSPSESAASTDGVMLPPQQLLYTQQNDGIGENFRHG